MFCIRSIHACWDCTSLEDCPFATLRLHSFVVVFCIWVMLQYRVSLIYMIFSLTGQPRSLRKVKCRSDARFVDSQWFGLWPECFWSFVFLVAQKVFFRFPILNTWVGYKKNCISFNEATCNPGHQIPETWHSWKPADPERCHVQGRNWPQIFGSSRVIKLAGILIVVFPLHMFFFPRKEY